MTKTSQSGIPWVRLIAQGVSIVASILLAFAIDAWWQSRLEDRAVREILVSLHEEFTVHQATLEGEKAFGAAQEA